MNIYEIHSAKNVAYTLARGRVSYKWLVFSIRIQPGDIHFAVDIWPQFKFVMSYNRNVMNEIRA